MTQTDGALKLVTLELPWLDLDGDGLGDPQKSCITPGTYRCEWRQSPKYGLCYEVSGVKGRSKILIHPANFNYQLLGCIALGKSEGKMVNRYDDLQRCVVKSRQAVAELNAWGNKEPFMLRIA